MSNLTDKNNSKSGKDNLLIIFLSVFVCTLAIAAVRLYYLHDNCDLATDVFYHIKISDMFPDFIFIKKFPWTQLSVWKTNFYDKELGFHIIIYLLRTLERLIGISTQAPFNFLSSIFVFAILSSYTFGCYLSKLKYSYLIPFLFLGLSPLFLQRLFLIRPHLISIILFGICLFVLFSEIKPKNKNIALFILAMIYAYFYSSPHLILLPIIAYSFSIAISQGLKNNVRKVLLRPVSAIAGIICAYIIHPQFPNTFIVWFIQSSVVFKNIILNRQGVRIGQEAYGANVYTAIFNSFLYLFTLFNLYLFFKLKNKKIQHITLFIISIISLLGITLSMRFIEYCIPANALLFIYLLNSNDKSLLHKKYTSAIFITCLICLFALNIKMVNIPSITKSPYYDFANWTEKNIKKDSYIGQINWDTFPFLFYSSDNFNYSFALDPMFSYAVYPERVKIINQYRHLEHMCSPEELSNALGTNLLFVSRKDPHIAIFLNKQGVYYLYQGKDGWLFDLNKQAK